MRHFRELPQSKIKLIFDSPLSEGAEVAQYPLHRETILYHYKKAGAFAPASDCRKSSKIMLSSRTIPQDGVAIPQIDMKSNDYKPKKFENPGDCHASVPTGSQ